jgi:hypothetical protein
MKRIAVLVALAAAVLLTATGGTALAGDLRGGVHVQWER